MLDLDLLPEEYAVCRLPAGSPLPSGLVAGPQDESVVSVSWTADELSIVCQSERAPQGATVQAPWRCLRVAGPLDLALTGVLSSVVGPLADARVSIVAFSTFDTDYVLVPSVRLGEAVNTLIAAGHRIAV